VNGSLPIGRYSISNRDKELLIGNVQKSDEGDYKCEGRNSNGRDHVIVHVDVQCIRICVFLSHTHTHKGCHLRRLKTLDAQQQHSLLSEHQGRLLGLGAGGGRHLPQWGSGPGVSAPKTFEILDANYCFLAQF